MYNPKGNSKEKSVHAVRFVECEPPPHLRRVVHRYIELKTQVPLSSAYRFHALPDACTYVVFDQVDPKVTGVTRLGCTAKEFCLGTSFHYVNVRFLPGVWQAERDKISEGMIDKVYLGDLPLRELNAQLAGRSWAETQMLLSTFVEQMMFTGMVAPNPITERLLRDMEEINSVSQMAASAGLSDRQLQRTLRRTTGFSPHDFLKILRLQRSLVGDPSGCYADQSHFIHSFRKATGYTPGRYRNYFDV
jgi:AraC-like DNA-binding protein